MLDFDIEWLESPAVENPEFRETWARLCIKVGDEYPGTVLDHASGTVRNSLYLPLYPLAEWFAYNWWTLFHESYAPTRGSREIYQFHHSLLSATEGFALPDLAVYPMGDFLQIAWKPRDLQHSGLQFLACGHLCAEKSETVERIRSFVDSVIGRLEARDIRGTELQTEWAAIRQMESEEQKFCETAAGIGVDPFNLPGGLDRLLIDLHENLPTSSFNELIAASSPENITAAARVVQQFRGKQALDVDNWRFQAPRVARSDWKRPWRIGYLFAEKLRRTLGLGHKDLPSDTALASALNANKTSLLSVLGSGAKPTLNGVSKFSEDGQASIGVVSSVASNKRFSFCRALFPGLLPNGERKGSVYVATSGNTPLQQASRAFAAEFLAPRTMVTDRLGDMADGYDRIVEVADSFGVSTKVIEHQMENARKADLSFVF